MTAAVLSVRGDLSSPDECAAANIEIAYRRLTDEFLSSQGLLMDYVGELPTPEECRDCKPNAMGWWSPIENGPMFTGPFLRACIVRAQRMHGQAGYEKAKSECAKMASGLIRAASASDVPGMIVRGFGSDGRCHYPLGSTDQTLPWFYGLHAYVMSDLPSPGEKSAIIAKMKEVANALEANDWRCPCDGAFKGQNRGNFKSEGKLVFRAATHAMYLFAAMYEITGDGRWRRLYLKFRDGKLKGCEMTGAEICEAGWRYDAPHFPVEGDTMWIYATAQGCLSELARMERDKAYAERYRRGLAYNAGRALPFLARAQKYDNKKEIPFKYANWRTGYKWQPQPDQKTAVRVAYSGIPGILGNRKSHERHFMTTPCTAIAVCGYAGVYRDQVAKAIAHYDFDEINLCEFFFAVCGWYAYAAFPARLQTGFGNPPPHK